MIKNPMRKIVLFMMLVLSLFFKTFEVRLESADLPSIKDVEVGSPKDIPVQRNSQDLLKRFFLVGAPEWNDYDCVEHEKQPKADAVVFIDSDINPATIHVGDPFFIVGNESKIVKGTVIKFWLSCDSGRVGLLRLKEKIDWFMPGNWGLLAFAQKKPSPDVLGSVTHLDDKSARRFRSIIEPQIPKHYTGRIGDVNISAARFVPPGSSEEYLLVTATFFETKEGYEDPAKFSKYSGFLFRHENKKMVLLEKVPGLVSINGITDLDRDRIYEVLVLVRSNDSYTETNVQMRLFNGKTLSESKRVMAEFTPP
jgi:hypothetical protein